METPLAPHGQHSKCRACASNHCIPHRMFHDLLPGDFPLLLLQAAPAEPSRAPSPGPAENSSLAKSLQKCMGEKVCKSPGSSQVSFHKQMQREKGIFEEQGESHHGIGRYLKEQLCATEVDPVPHVWELAPASAPQILHPGKVAGSCTRMHSNA